MAMVWGRREGEGSNGGAPALMSEEHGQLWSLQLG